MIIRIVENVLESVNSRMSTAMDCVDFPTTSKNVGMVEINGVDISKIESCHIYSSIKRGRFKRMF